MQRNNERFVERLPLVLPQPWQGYALTGLFCLIVFAVRMAVQGLLPIGYPFVSFFPAVILSSFLFGVRPGLFAGVLCGLLSWYFFISPQRGFAFDSRVAMALAFYAAVVGIDVALINFLQKANFNLAIERERNRVLAENRELLFHELQHRVSNNLQVVAAVMSLQRRHIDHDGACKALDDASNRLALVGRISRALYDPAQDGQNIDMFLTRLTQDIVEASGRDDISVTVSAPPHLTLESGTAVPLALIVAEAVSNAIEHGLSGRGGSIEVTLEDISGSLSLRIADNGNGLAPDFDMESGDSLGLRIAHALASQLSGHFALHPRPEGGAVARLDLPAPAR